MDTENLLTIGAFAARTRLSAKALRLYDRLGLLTPAYVDDVSGYRYRTLALLHPSGWRCRASSPLRPVGAQHHC
ncbi:hypothetical protein GCM10010344_74530 [Streptomyces bluensis]|nr:hypothetical protein GCM10010344_74530 [Streptomyces bluensis]